MCRSQLMAAGVIGALFCYGHDLRASIQTPVCAVSVASFFPLSGTLVGDTTDVRADVSISGGCTLQSFDVRAASGQPVTLTPDLVFGGWRAIVPLDALPHGSFVLTFTATDSAGDVGTANVSLVHDRKPTLVVSAPEERYLTRSGLVHVTASCSDDVACTRIELSAVSIVTAFPLGTIPHSHPTNIDEDVSLAALDGQPVGLQFVAYDSAGQSVVLTRTVYVETNPRLVEIVRESGEIMDDSTTQTLFFSHNLPISQPDSLTVRDKVTQRTVPLEAASVFSRPHHDALLGLTGPVVRNTQWRHGALLPLDSNAFFQGTLRVSGTSATWIGGPGEHRLGSSTSVPDTLYSANLQTGVAVRLEGNAFPNVPSLATNGDVLIEQNGATVRYHDGVKQVLTPDEALSAIAKSGWSAFKSTTGSPNVWLRSPQGVVSQLTFYTDASPSDPAIVDFSDDGRVALRHAGRTWVHQLGQSPIEVGGAWDQVFWRDGSLIVIVGRSVLQMVTSSPGAPTGLRASLTNLPAVQLDWSGAREAVTYTVKRGTAPGAETVLAVGVTAPKYIDAAVTPGTTYYYVVSAVNAFGEMISSEVAIRPVRTIPVDMDGDARADLAVYRPSTGQWFVLPSTTGYGYGGALDFAWGLPGDVPLPADFDGDGRPDLTVYRPSTGTWYIRYSSDGYSFATWRSFQWGLPGDIPLVADLDGDRKSDLVVYRPTDGTWYVRFSADSYSYNTWASYQWGLPGDVPIAADFDGDGQSDLVVYRPSSGEWLVRFSLDQYVVATSTAYQWGLPGDIPLSADFDADGKADLVVYRPSTGTWYVRFSSSSYSYANWSAYQWGLPGDIPVSNDFDGDGKTDLAVWRPSDGYWYIRLSSTGFSFTGAVAYGWGLPGDIPLARH